MLSANGPVNPAFVSANKDLTGATPLEVYQACAEALTGAGIMVIPNMHLMHSGWCCSTVDGNGLPFNVNWSLQGFYDSWVTVAKLFQYNPRVIGFDLYNEPRPSSLIVAGETLMPSWGDGNPQTDMRSFYQNAANAIHKVSPEKLVFCEGLSYATDLSQAGTYMVTPVSKTVYSLHDYPWFHDAVQDYQTYQAELDPVGGYLLAQNKAPLWIGEFGVNSGSDFSVSNGWFPNIIRWLGETDADWCLWHLDATLHEAHEPVTNVVKATEGQRETFTIFAADWTTVSNPDLLSSLQSVMPATIQPGKKK
jgi:hypothetical protein